MGSANIGSVARSTAAFGLDKLRLVSPRCKMDQKTSMWACYGKRVLEKVEFFEDLDSALSDLDTAVAMTRQDGKSRHRHYSLAEYSEELVPTFAEESKVGLVFGNEESGLANHHLKSCRCSAEIPVVATDGSLNLAHAVSITLYELIGRKIQTKPQKAAKSIHQEKANAQRLRELFENCQQTLASANYPSHASTLEKESVKLQTIINRCGLENWEVRTLLGMVKEVQSAVQNSDQP